MGHNRVGPWKGGGACACFGAGLATSDERRLGFHWSVRLYRAGSWASRDVDVAKC